MPARVSALASTVLLVLSCDKSSAPEPGPTLQPDPAPAASNAVPTSLDRLLADIDRDADPCASFYDYACGGWAARTERPADKPRYSRAFATVQEENERVLGALLVKAAADAEAGQASPLDAKLGNFYAACLDEAAVEAKGTEPLAPILASIDAIDDRKQLMKTLGELHATVFGRISWLGGGASPFFMIRPDADYKQDPRTNIGHVLQSGLGLPSREIYLSEGAKPLVEAYTGHVERMLVLTGVEADRAKTLAAQVVELETALAKASQTPVEQRDDEKNYVKEGVKGLRKRGKKLDWSAYLAAAGLPESKSYNLRSADFMKAVGTELRKRDLDTIKAYLRWHVAHAMAPYLTKAFVDENFQLQRIVLGLEALPSRDKRCVDEAMWALPDLVGKKFVEARFAGESKDIADEMIDQINAAMEASFPALAWMDDTTRARAKEKIQAMGRKIGYPKTWRDYADVNVARGEFFANAMSERAANARREAAKIDAPVDRDEFHMPAPLVNAYYNPTNNEIAFPAGILQPPFFSVDQPGAMNFGGIGAVMGHELTHGFDDQGRKYDKDGKLATWWEPEVSKRFEERVACVQAQYDAYEALPGKQVNGTLTAGENIADIGGLKEAYVAYKAWEQATGNTDPVAEGLTNDQVFFVAWAQNWCQLSTEESTARRLETDPHSPGRFRAEGPLADLPAFWDAFSCAEGTPMHPANACEIW